MTASTPREGRLSGDEGGACAVVQLDIAALKGDWAVRRQRLDPDHAQALADVDAAIPPILVHRPTMQVVDGHHRVRAARVRGASTISAILVDCSEDEALIAAVRANVSHGKPLSTKERRDAVGRLIHVRPALSDRAIAEICGTSTRTVAGMRRDAPFRDPVETRIGRDGRARPTDLAATRARVAKALKEDPDASLRQIASKASVAPGTVRRIRSGSEVGDNLLPPHADEIGVTAESGSSGVEGDPVEWISERTISRDEVAWVLGRTPVGRLYDLADTAREVARVWSWLAEAAEKRAGRLGSAWPDDDAASSASN